ncbi:MAG: AsmA family protein, partial [Pseudomonadota bacterium]
MNTFLMWLGGVLIAILAALFTVPHFIDWNGYRGVFEEEASRLFGRDVRVGGSVNVRLLPTPYVNFEKLRVADTSGVIGAPLFAADSFTMWLDVPPLLKGIFEARRVELQRPVVRLAVDRSGTPNWTTLEFRPGALPFVPADVTLNSVEIIDGQVAYDAADVGTLAQLDAINGTLATQGLRGPVSFRGFADIAGDTREVRLSTTEISPQGDTRLKATVRQPDGSASHTIEATATALFEDPVFAGALTSTTRLDQARDAPFVDIKAEFKATTKGLQLENALASFEKLGEPQLVTGKIETSWGKQRKIS